MPEIKDQTTNLMGEVALVQYDLDPDNSEGDVDEQATDLRKIKDHFTIEVHALFRNLFTFKMFQTN